MSLLVENEEKARDLSQGIDDIQSHQCLFLYTLSQAYDKSNMMDVSIAWHSLHSENKIIVAMETVLYISFCYSMLIIM